jgi:quinolinate synthase
LEPRIELDEATRIAAKAPLDRMLEMAGRSIGRGDLGACGDVGRR